jgi:hypothetical protein
VEDTMAWAEAEEAKELKELEEKGAAKASWQPSPADKAFMDEEMKKAKELYGEDFGEDISEDFDNG